VTQFESFGYKISKFTVDLKSEMQPKIDKNLPDQKSIINHISEEIFFKRPN